MQILVADDDRASGKALTHVLRRWGHEPICVEDGELAWDCLANPAGPRLAIVDWMMPRLDGLNLCKRVRAQLDRYVYLILLTARSNLDDLVQGFGAGADDYMVKPFNPAELNARLHSGTRILELQDELLRESRARELAQAQNVRALEEREAELARWNENLERIVQERTAEVHALLDQKDMFISHLGHDLKTPLTPLVALLPALSQEAKTPRAKRIVDVFSTNVHYMRNLAEKTLQLAKLQRSSGPVTLVPVDFNAELSSVIRRFASELEEKNIAYRSAVHTPLWVYADPLGLETLLHNLISNAIQYSECGASITIEDETSLEGTTIRVSDNGIGLTPEHVKCVFDAFYRADPSRHDRFCVGLGLSICSQIVEAHGGRIWAESPGLGQGAVFAFTLKSCAFLSSANPEPSTGNR